MKVVPAVDLLHGHCVQLRGGDPSAMLVDLPDAEAALAHWIDARAPAIHLVDLDAAFGEAPQRSLVAWLLQRAGAALVPVTVGGGVRDDLMVASLLQAGAQRVILGTAALSDLQWFGWLSRHHPDRLVLALDHRGGEVVTRGWTSLSGHAVLDVLEKTADLPIAGVLVTDVSVEGGLGGIVESHVAPIATAAKRMGIRMIHSGGISTVEDLETLERLGVDESVVGSAFYTGRLPGTLWEEARWRE